MLAATLLAGALICSGPMPTRRLAVTIDDLPHAGGWIEPTTCMPFARLPAGSFRAIARADRRVRSRSPDRSISARAR